MRIKHSKYKNTGLIFELLVKQIAADTLSKKDSPAIKILKKYFSGDAPLSKEYRLYEFISKNRNISQAKAESILSTIVEISKRLNTPSLKKSKYELIKELKQTYNIDEFFAVKVRDYKAFAALYCLLEAHSVDTVIDPDTFISNRTTLLEHLTNTDQNPEDVKDTIIEEYSKYDKDLKLLTYKILLEKFNSKYQHLLPDQKRILKEFIISNSSSVRLKEIVNEEYGKLKTKIEKHKASIKDDVLKIKLNEVHQQIKPVGKKHKIGDEHLVNLLQYYDLVNELDTV